MALIDNIPFLKNLSVDDIEEKLNLFRQYQHYIYITINILIAIQLYFSVISPQFKELAKEKEQLGRFTTLYQNKKKNTTDKKAIEDQISSLSDTLEVKQQDFFNANEVKEFSFTEINKICKIFNLKLTDVNFKKSRGAEGNVISYPLDLKLTGDFYDLMDFIYELENYDKIITIEDLTLQAKSVDPVILQVALTLYLHSIENT